MGKLSNYSIESDEVVLLEFSDGQNHRAHIKELPKLLGKEDLKKIQAALKLRANYINKHLPNWLKIIIVVALALSLSGESSKAAQAVKQYVQQHILHSQPTPSGSQTSHGDKAGNSPKPSSTKHVDTPASANQIHTEPVSAHSNSSKSKPPTPKNVGKISPSAPMDPGVAPRSLGQQLNHIIQQLKPSSPPNTRQHP